MDNYNLHAVPDLDNPDRPPIDPDRARRAAGLRVVPVEGTPDLYQVEGQSEFYNVALAPHFSCDCGDAIFREQICKHLIAVLAHRGDPEATNLMAGRPFARSESRPRKPAGSSWRTEFRSRLKAIQEHGDGGASAPGSPGPDPFAAWDN